jgi:AAA ATPase domain
LVNLDEYLNPYRPGAGNEPPALLGRDALLHRFDVVMGRASLKKPDKSMMPIGLRGVGKTVLLNRFAEQASEKGCVVGFIEAPEAGDFRLLLANRLRQVLLELDRAGPVSALVRKAMAVLKAFAYQLPDGSQIRIDVDALAGKADSGLLSDDITDLLVATGEAARDRDTAVLLAVDEVQYLSSEELGALITAVHRTTQLNLPVVLVGAGLPQLPGLAGEAKSYAERLFEFPMIGSLQQNDAEAALVLPAEEAAVEFQRDALEFLVAEAQGYPYFLQEWGYHVWNIAMASPISLADAGAASLRVREALDRNFFLVRFDRLTPKEKEYLRAMAQLGAGPHRSGDIAALLGVRVESVAPRRSLLITKGMIYSPAHGDTAFTVPLFDQFLIRELPDWQPQEEAATRRS